jgi:hypothetical protein
LLKACIEAAHISKTAVLPNVRLLAAIFSAGSDVIEQHLPEVVDCPWIPETTLD